MKRVSIFKPYSYFAENMNILFLYALEIIFLQLYLCIVVQTMRSHTKMPKRKLETAFLHYI